MEDDPYYIINLSKIKKSYDLWTQYLPEVEVYYAMKCNPDKMILEEMNKLVKTPINTLVPTQKSVS